MGKDIVCQAWRREFDSWDPHDGGREPTPESCPSTITCAPWCAHSKVDKWTHTMNTEKCNNFFLELKKKFCSIGWGRKGVLELVLQSRLASNWKVLPDSASQMQGLSMHTPTLPSVRAFQDFPQVSFKLYLSLPKNYLSFNELVSWLITTHFIEQLTWLCIFFLFLFFFCFFFLSLFLDVILKLIQYIHNLFL